MMKKNILLICVCLLFQLAASRSLLFAPLTGGADADTQLLEKFVVTDQNTIFVPEDYAKLQDAINAADPDTIIRVKAGTYYERLFVNKPLNLIGEERNSTIIIGCVDVFSNHVVLKGFTVRNAPAFVCGITLYSNSNVISENTIESNGEDGIWLWYNTRNNTISRNIIESNNFCGITLDNSTDNVISENFIANHQHGMLLTHSRNNTVIGNSFMTNAHCGFHLDFSDDDMVYHNNFISSPLHCHDSTCIWDNDAEGNYWDGLATADLNGDGISDTSFVINEYNRDNYPLMERWSMLRTYNAFVWNERTYLVTTYSYCTIASFSFNHQAKQISFNVTGPLGEVGFCNVTVPKLLLSEPWQVLINGAATSSIKIENNTCSSLRFTFSFSTKMVRIIGTEALDKIPPTADAGPDQVVNKTAQVTFDGSDSWDNVGITSYKWAFIDGTPRTLTGMNPTYAFNTSGNYTVTLRVEDAVGNYDEETVTIIVLGEPETSPWLIGGLAVLATIGIIVITILWKRNRNRKHAKARAKRERRKR